MFALVILLVILGVAALSFGAAVITVIVEAHTEYRRRRTLQKGCQRLWNEAHCRPFPTRYSPENTPEAK